jgi:hypothetical protein
MTNFPIIITRFEYWGNGELHWGYQNWSAKMTLKEAAFRFYSFLWCYTGETFRKDIPTGESIISCVYPPCWDKHAYMILKGSVRDIDSLISVIKSEKTLKDFLEQKKARHLKEQAHWMEMYEQKARHLKEQAHWMEMYEQIEKG